MTMMSCPSESTLRLVGTDAVGEATFAGLEGHVEQCPECQKVLEAAMKAEPQATRPAPAGSAPPALPGLVIQRLLGRGGASVVYLAWEPELKRHVAVKLFPKNSLVDPHAREHWLREARALSRVAHDRVVAIHNAGETAEWLWLVIEYVPGGTLKDRLTEPLQPRDAARLTEAIARAVGYFHTRGVCHLDLKPSNILLDGEPGAPWEGLSPKISDFGIARLEGETGATETGANGPKGTPSYMAPEQVAALPGTIGPAADLHALGALLYHLLTGRPAFQGASSAETLDQVRNQDPVPPRRLNGRIPRDLETICLKCLEKVQSRRYRSAGALAGDLRFWLEGRPIKAHRVSAIGHAWRWCGRHTAVAALLFTLAMTLSTGVVGLLVLLKEAEDERARLAVTRRRAEAYEKFSANSADQLALFLQMNVRQRSGITPDQTEAMLLTLRSSTLDLRNQGIVASTTIGILEEQVGWALASFNRVDEARETLSQAIADLRHSLASNHMDRLARNGLLDGLMLSGYLAEGAGEIEDALAYFQEAAAVRIAIEPQDSEKGDIAYLYIKLQVLADRLGRDGRTEMQERSRRLCQPILRHLLGPGFDRPLDAPSLPLEALASLLQVSGLGKTPSDETRESREWRELLVVGLIASSLGPISPFFSSSSAREYDRDPESGAIALIAAVRERCSKLGLADATVPATVHTISDCAITIASGERKNGRLDEASATAARLMTLARRLVREYPESGHAFRLLSEAYSQERKNGIPSAGAQSKLVEEATEQAIGAARRVLALEVDGRLGAETRRHLERLTERLASLKAERNAPGSSVP